MAAALSIVVAYVAATEIVKRYFFRRSAGARVDGRHIT
jgi:hypothetical protein